MLQAQGQSLREISRVLRLSRNTVRRILRTPDGPDAPTTQAGAGALEPALQQRLQEVYVRAKGNAVRMGQILAEEDDLNLPYSTLTRWVRQAELRQAPKRVGQYHFEPGQEMQHDTSPHRLEVAGVGLTAQCAALVLAYSQRLFMQYYARFTRLEAKHFLLQAAQFMDGTCPRCVIDNTSVVVVGGSGPDAVFAPEMKAFARSLNFEFMAHRLNDPNRKARIERPFSWIEGNFLPGRRFDSFEDVNAQARGWCVEVANAKPKRSLGMPPEAAYVLEKPHLLSLPALLPSVYEVFERVVDLYGFVSVDTNRYSVPERLVGQTVHGVQALRAHRHPCAQGAGGPPCPPGGRGATCAARCPGITRCRDASRASPRCTRRGCAANTRCWTATWAALTQHRRGARYTRAAAAAADQARVPGAGPCWPRWSRR